MAQWCNMYEMWCSDVEYEIEDGFLVCCQLCNSCEWCENIRPIRDSK